MTVLGASKPDLSPLPLFPPRALWTLSLNNQLTVPPAYDKERVYFGLSGDQLVAYSILEGKQLWLVEGRPRTTPAVGADMIFCAEGDDLVAHRIGDGSIAWRRPLPASSVPLVTEKGWLVSVASSGAVDAFRADDGHPIWTHDIGSPAGGAPAIAGDHVYIPTVDGRIVALTLESGDVAWERHIGGRANDLIVVDDRLFVGSNDNFFYCIMTKTGRVDWRWRTGGDVIGTPAIDEHHIYFVSLDNVLRKLNRVSGAQVWMRPLPVRPVWGPLLVVDRLMVGGQANQLSGFKLTDGSVAGSYDAGAEVAAAPHAVSDPSAMLPVILVVTRDIAKGAVARLVTRRIEPQADEMTAPLPNVIKMGQATQTR